jgi:hypothetical protein
MPDEHENGHRPGAGRIVSAVLLALAALALGAMGTCGTVFTAGHLHGVDASVLVFAVPSALVGIGGFVWCLRTLGRLSRGGGG